MPQTDTDALKQYADRDEEPAGGGIPEFKPFPVLPAAPGSSIYPSDPMSPPGPDRIDYDALRSTLERGDALKNDQIDRLLAWEIGYMELTTPAGAFSCGQCLFAAENGFCNNTAVLAPISALAGCCSRFWPKLEAPKFPPGKPR